MIKHIAVFGATGFPGLQVVHALLDAGFSVSVLSSNLEKDAAVLPPNVHLVEGNWMYHHDLKRFLSKVEAVYCSLSVDMQEQQDDFHAETDGLREIINASQACGIRRLAYMSSVLQYNQVENQDMWWVFNVKKDAVNYVRDSGMPFTIFYPGTFMENFESYYRKGNQIRLFGRSQYPIYYISVKDYARMVAKSFLLPGTEDREYFMQGPDCYKLQEAARLYVRNHHNGKLSIKTVPEYLMKFYALFSPAWKFRACLAEALNNNNETFISEDTWKELGKPELSFADYAKHAP